MPNTALRLCSKQTPKRKHLNQRLHTRENIPRNLPLALHLPTHEDLLIVMELIRSLLQPILPTLRCGSCECPLATRYNDLVDGELDVELDGSEYPLI